MLTFTREEDLRWTAYRWEALKSCGMDSSLYFSKEKFAEAKEMWSALATASYGELLKRDPSQVNPSLETIQKIHHDAFRLIFPGHGGQLRTSEHRLNFRPAAASQTLRPEIARLRRDFDAEFHWATNQAENRETHLTDAVSRYHVRFLQIHPFECGNGAVARIILSHQLAHHLQCPELGKWTPVGRLDYFYAMAQGELFGDVKPFQAVIGHSLKGHQIPWQHEGEHPGWQVIQGYCKDRNIKLVFQEETKQHAHERQR